MRIPLATTRIQLLATASTGNAEDWDSPDIYAATGPSVRAHLSGPSGNAQSGSAGASSAVTYKLIADLCPIDSGMRVRDESSGKVYDVAWSLNRHGYVIAGLTQAIASS